MIISPYTKLIYCLYPMLCFICVDLTNVQLDAIYYSVMELWAIRSASNKFFIEAAAVFLIVTELGTNQGLTGYHICHVRYYGLGCISRNLNKNKGEMNEQRKREQKSIETGEYFIQLSSRHPSHLVWSKIDFLGTKIRLISSILDGFSWFKRHLTSNIGRNILVDKIFMGLPTWQKYTSRAWFMATPRK